MARGEDELLERIAATDIVDTDWARLKETIKAKVEQNITLYATEGPQKPYPAPPYFPPIQTPTGGLKLAPFPPRKRSELNINAAPSSYMNDSEILDMKEAIFTQLEEFDEGPPFTIQRVCELCLHPKPTYKSVGKYLRAVEKSLLVTSAWGAFPPIVEKAFDPSTRPSISMNIGPNSSAPATPLFSPIPFLHGDARGRSKSRSPPPLALGAPATELQDDQKALGLVDELDDPSPGHMSDHPVSLTSVTTVGAAAASSATSMPTASGSRGIWGGSLEQRFVKSDTDMVLDQAEGKESTL